MKAAKKLLVVTLAMVLAVSSLADNTCVAQAKGKKKKAVTSVTITNVDSPVLVLKKKGTYKLKVKVKTTGGASKKVSFSSSKPKVVSVSSKGKLKAKKKGTAKITVKSKFNKKKKAVLTVKVGTPVKKVTIKNKKISLKVGETSKLSVSLSPKKPTRKTLSYTSSNKKVATVDKKGVVKAIGAGEAKITVKATDGSKKKAVATVTVQEESTTTEQSTEDDKNPTEIVYTEKDLVWKDDFNGTSLSEKDWNYETHEPGWVNSELQEYVKSNKNIYVKDGNLVLKAIKTTGADGNPYYTSGRINTQGKHDFKYGKFEARVKVPQGKGFLPAFWMMPTDENLYGQWPKCGEIDIMEVMGQTNNLVYGTIHYGEPHQESQGAHTLSKGDFTNDYHIFSCEWEPGRIKWFVDGILYHEENDWYSTKEGQGTVSYPAPFDQPFYMILNLAVGGSWVGYPDDKTSFDNAEFVVDYVKVYQKDASVYDENVERPVKEFKPRDPDKNGNYVNNGDFSTAESLTDNKDWVFLTAENGEATAAIQSGEMTINIQNDGDAEHSVQLVQADIPMKKGATYRVSFKAKAAGARSMKVAVKAPDRGYAEYMKTVTDDLTAEYKSFVHEFTMKNESDANGRLEFNMGAADSTEDITIDDVEIKMIKDADPNAKEVKTVLSDGNHVYNGSFQEGAGRLGYWEITNKAGAGISVTDLKDGRRLKVTVDKTGTKAEDVIAAQSDLALLTNQKYALTFDAQADAAKTLKVVVAGKTYTANLTNQKKTYEFKIETGANLSNKNIAFYMGQKGTIYLDNVRLVEDSLIKNGSFNAGFVGFDTYVEAPAIASGVVDSLTEKNAADFTIKNTGDAEYKIQLKQSNVLLKKDQWYILKFDIKSSIDRDIQYSIQRDGSKHNDDWSPYVQETVSLTGGGDYKPVEILFKMEEPTDAEAIFNIAMGGQKDKVITQQHRICIDNISLEETSAPVIPTGINLLKNADFSSDMAGWTETIANWGGAFTAAATSSIDKSKGAITYNIANVGTEDWHVQLKQEHIILEKGCNYTVKLKVTSTEARTIKLALLNSKYDWYGGQDIVLEKNKEQEVTIPISVDKPTSSVISMVVSMGQIFDNEGRKVNTPASTITLSGFSLVKNAPGAENQIQEKNEPEVNQNEPEVDTEEPKSDSDEETPDEQGENLLINADFSEGLKEPWVETIAESSWGTDDDGNEYTAAASRTIKKGVIQYDITDAGFADWHVQLKQTGIHLIQGHKYKVTFKITSDEARTVKMALLNPGNHWFGGEDMELYAGQEYCADYTLDMTEETEPNASFVISMGKIEGVETPASKITISELYIEDVTEAE